VTAWGCLHARTEDSRILLYYVRYAHGHGLALISLHVPAEFALQLAMTIPLFKQVDSVLSCQRSSQSRVTD
jgi:hypothetical protein